LEAIGVLTNLFLISSIQAMILVFGTEQRLLCMAHLIGADSLPSKDQLDSNLVSQKHWHNKAVK
jgi:hypothetical protein